MEDYQPVKVHVFCIDQPDEWFIPASWTTRYYGACVFAPGIVGADLFNKLMCHKFPHLGRVEAQAKRDLAIRIRLKFVIRDLAPFVECTRSDHVKIPSYRDFGSS